jgi:predicted RNA-binding protein YlqC (UPF0109 family)
MRELLEFLARSLVEDPGAVAVTEVEEIEAGGQTRCAR